MGKTLTQNPIEAVEWGWEKYEGFVEEALARPLTKETADEWIKDWSQAYNLLYEVYNRLSVAADLHMEDKTAEDRYNHFLDMLYPKLLEMDQKFKEKFLASGITPDGFDIPIRNMKAQAEIYREENLPLLSEHEKLSMEYGKLIGMQTVEWEGKSITITQLRIESGEGDRETREKAWRLGSARVLEDREKINAIWQKAFDVRLKIAANAGKKTYRDYMWLSKLRFDYTPEDCETFQRAIEEVVVPAVKRVYERRRDALKVDTLRPWDIGTDVMRNQDITLDALNRPPLKPFRDINDLEQKGSLAFHNVAEELGNYFDMMMEERLMDLPNYKGKRPGAYCTSYPTSKRPFVLMNAVGTQDDVRTLFHELGHAFHVWETNHFEHHHFLETPMEFNEVASMAMELLASPYIRKSNGGFYDDSSYARAMIEHLEGILMFWPYMAVVDAAQHWAYTKPDQGRDPSQVDAMWGSLWDRFIQGVDWSGLDDQKVTGWHRKLHPHTYPFYYVEYGLAQLGAVQVWRNALRDQKEAVVNYRKALSLGSTVGLPKLFETAGAKFGFDAGIMKMAVDLCEEQIEKFEKML